MSDRAQLEAEAQANIRLTVPRTALVAGGGQAPPSPYATPSVIPTDTDNPAIPHPAYWRMLRRMWFCRDLMMGTEAIRDGGTIYLPKLAAESDDDYLDRVQLAALYNGFSRVVLAGVGMLMQQEPVLSKDMPAQLKALWENVDGKGTHGAVFTADLLQSGMIDGHDGILVDYENADSATLDRSQASAAAVPGKPLSADDEARIGLRPYWMLVKADDVIKPIYQTVKGKETLVLLIVRENVDVRSGQFGVVGMVRYRVYTNENGTVMYQLWETPIGAQRPVLKEPPRVVRNVQEIPWSPNRPGRKLSKVEVVPPLMDLAYMNIEHHQTKTNLLNLEKLGCVPSPVRIGAQKDDKGNYPAITLGPRSTIEAPVIEGVPKPFYWTSPDVAVLVPAQKTLESTEAGMGAMGMAFLAPQPRATETAEAKRLDSTAQNATLSTVGRAGQDCLEAAFGFTAQFLGVKAGSVAISSDFENLVMEPAVMMAYVAAVAEAGLPPKLLVLAWQAQGRIPDDIDPDELVSEMLANAAATKDQQQMTGGILAKLAAGRVPVPARDPAPVA